MRPRSTPPTSDESDAKLTARSPMNVMGSSSWWRSRSAASRGSSFIRSCPASGRRNGAMASVARAEPMAQRGATRVARNRAASRSKARSRSSKQRQEDAKRVPLSVRLDAGRARLVEAPVHGDRRRIRRRRFPGRDADGRRPAWPRSASLSRPAAACRSGCCRSSRSGGRRSFSRLFRTPSTSSCAASRPACRCSTASS